MRYNLAWLRRTKEIQNLIPVGWDLIDAIPSKDDRLLVEQQYRVATQKFTADVALGHSSQFSGDDIISLVRLAQELAA